MNYFKQENLPDVKIRSVFFVDSIKDFDTVRVVDPTTAAELLVYRGKYDQLVAECNDTERSKTTEIKSTEKVDSVIEKLTKSFSINQLLMALGFILILILLIKR